MERIIKTWCIVALYCIAWVLLEQILYGAAQNSTEDGIIMLMFIPVIYKAVGKTEK